MYFPVSFPLNGTIIPVFSVEIGCLRIIKHN